MIEASPMMGSTAMTFAASVLRADYMAYDGWVILVAALAAAACALPGCFLVLRQSSMMGDAISHAVLPGLAAAFMLTGLRTSWVMFVGAAVVGVLTALFTRWLHRFGGVDRGAAMGVVFTTMFALGLVMIEQAHDRVDLDPGCVLYGAVELAPLDTVALPAPLSKLLGDLEPPRAAVVLTFVLLLNLAFVFALFKELRIASFDPQLARSMGIPANLIHYLLMTLVAITTVASFEAIGSILVIAMLIVPAAAAHLLTDRLAPMIALAILLAVIAATLGHVFATEAPIYLGGTPSWMGLNEIRGISSAGMMAVVAGGILLLAALLGPRHGLAIRWWDRWRIAGRVISEDALGLLYRLEELHAEDRAPMHVGDFKAALNASTLRMHTRLFSLVQCGDLSRNAEGYHLTEAGRSRARRLVRAHRLWESYLADRLDLPVDHVHAPAELLEHVTDEQLADRLAAATGRPDRDPHGRDVPE